jgi:hypothetical protein
MRLKRNRRRVLLGLSTLAMPLGVSAAQAQSRTTWSATEAYDALLADSARVIDVRSREE